MTKTPGLLTIAESIALAKVGRSHLFAAIKRGELETTKPGRRRLVRRASLARWLRVPETDLVD